MKGIFKGNVAVYKDLNLVTVTIKRYLSREHSERIGPYTVSVDPTVWEKNFKIVCGGIYVYARYGTSVRVLVQRSSGFCDYRPSRERKKTDRD